MEYTKGESIKSLITDKLLNCDTHFGNDQLVAILDIFDEVGVPDMYEALKKAQEDINWMLNNDQFLNPDAFNYRDKALAKVDEK